MYSTLQQELKECKRKCALINADNFECKYVPLITNDQPSNLNGYSCKCLLVSMIIFMKDTQMYHPFVIEDLRDNITRDCMFDGMFDDFNGNDSSHVNAMRAYLAKLYNCDIDIKLFFHNEGKIDGISCVSMEHFGEIKHNYDSDKSKIIRISCNHGVHFKPALNPESDFISSDVLNKRIKELESAIAGQNVISSNNSFAQQKTTIIVQNADLQRSDMEHNAMLFNNPFGLPLSVKEEIRERLNNEMFAAATRYNNNELIEKQKERLYKFNQQLQERKDKEYAERIQKEAQELQEQEDKKYAEILRKESQESQKHIEAQIEAERKEKLRNQERADEEYARKLQNLNQEHADEEFARKLQLEPEMNSSRERVSSYYLGESNNTREYQSRREKQKQTEQKLRDLRDFARNNEY